jgi:radical SAM superfamily enzyme YgiQ (UPF0313 family)
MIEYERSIYRPPSEARSLILQATVGCSHNQCAFCVAYQGKRFRVRSEEELFPEIDWAAQTMGQVRRVFLADGDALVLSTERLLRILERLYDRLPGLERVTAYGSPQNLLHKGAEDLKRLRAAGLTMIYYGVESGHDEVLTRIRKGATAEQLCTAGFMARDGGMDLSVTVILGLGGPRLSIRHAKATAQVLNQIVPRYASALTLMLEPRAPSFEEVFDDPAWRMLEPIEVLTECRTLIAHIEADGVVFRSNHASNYLALAGDLQTEKDRLLKEIDAVLDNPRSAHLRPDYLRGL